MNTPVMAAWIAAAALLPASALAQSSSLYLDESTPAAAQPAAYVAGGAQPDRLSPAVARASLSAVKMPEPRKYAVHDLLTIIVNETTESDSKANINTKKESKFDGDIASFPNLNLANLLKLQVQGGALSNGPQVAAHMKKDFTGDGEAKRVDTFTSRITAQVVDVKPNGTLVLESRKFIKTNEETLEMVITGTCRKEDVTIDNTVLSTQLYDLHLTKNHKGQLQQGTNKGWITRVFDTIFGF